MANIPVNFGGIILNPGLSVTGSFAGLTVFGGESILMSDMGGSQITFKYGTGINAAGQVIESNIISTILYPGTTLPLYITFCSVVEGAPVILYT